MEDSASSSTKFPPQLRKHVSTACCGCKQRRRKCNGERPCHSCRSLNLECTFEAEHDGRRREARKRKLVQLRSDSDLLHELLESIRGSEDDQVTQIVGLIRSKASTDAVKACIEQQVADNHGAKRQRSSPEMKNLGDYTDNPVSTSDTEQLSQARMRRRINICHLADNPPLAVRGSPWTTIIDDDALVSNLVSVWFTWGNPFYDWIDQDLFVQDMKRGDTNCKYCSPFLVNALLAAACPFSDYDEARNQIGETSALMSSLIEEAKRLFESEQEHSITTAQGLAMLFSAIACTGHDASGFHYLQYAASLCRDLEIKPAAVSHDSPIEEWRAMSKALDTTCWGIFNFTTLVHLVFQKRPEMLPPSRSVPTSHGAQDSLDWSPYPASDPPKAAYHAEVLHARSLLSIIARDAALLLHGAGAYGRGEESSMRDSVSRLHTHLLEWHSSLPAHLAANTSSPPGVLLLLGYYHMIIITIFAPIRWYDLLAANPTLTRTQPKDHTLSAALSIVHICRLWRSSWGNSHINIFLMQPAALASSFLLECEDVSNYETEILDLWILFRAVSRRWSFAFAALRMFQLTARQQGRRLPVATEKLLEDFETQDWQRREVKGVMSHYPVPAAGQDGALKMQNMSEFLYMMEKLDVNESQ